MWSICPGPGIPRQLATRCLLRQRIMGFLDRLKRKRRILLFDRRSSLGMQAF